MSIGGLSPEPIGVRILAALSDAGISQSELARRLAGPGASAARVASTRRLLLKWLAGDHAPSEPSVRRLARALNLPDDAFLVGAVDDPALSDSRNDQASTLQPARIDVIYDLNPVDVKQQIVFHDLDLELVDQAVEELRSLPLIANVELVFSVDLGQSIRDRGKGQIRDHYSNSRPLGSVAAKAMPDATRDVDVILIHAGLFSKHPDHQGWRVKLGIDLGHIIRHEGWHLVLQQWGEDPTSLLDGLPPGVGGPYQRLAMLLVDEFRIERALCEDARGSTKDMRLDVGSVERAIETLRETLAVTTTSEREGYLELIGLLHAYGRIAVRAAAQEVIDETSLSNAIAASRLRHSAAGEQWSLLVQTLALVPGARTRMSVNMLNEASSRVGALIEIWARQIGIPAL